MWVLDHIAENDQEFKSCSGRKWSQKYHNDLLNFHKCIWYKLSIVAVAIHGLNEPPHDKTNKMTVPPAKTPINLGIRPVWSVFAVLRTQAFFMRTAKTDQTGCPGWSESLLGAHAILLVLSGGGSNYKVLLFVESANKIQEQCFPSSVSNIFI